jgi:hypothetical protein
MKLKCKQCERKFKVKKESDVDCENSQCDLKFNMSTNTMTFSSDWMPIDITKVKFEEHFESPNPPPKTQREFTEAEWAAMCENGYF